MSQPTNGPHDQLQRLIRGIGSQVDHVIADGVRRLGGEPVTQVAMFSQSIKCPWDVETGFTAELAGHTLGRELAKGSRANADRIDEAVAVLRENARKGITTIVESPTKTIVYWNWRYGYTVAARMHVESDMQRPPNGRGTSATHGEPKRPRRPMSRNAHDRSRAGPPLHKVTATARQPR